MSASTLNTTTTLKTTTRPDAPIKGLLTGSMVLTMHGYRAIETLKVGDRLVTRGGVRVIETIESQQAEMRPIRIAEGTLGCKRPKQDMMVAPNQEILVRDWRAEVLFGSEQVIVPVARMVDGKFIAQVGEKGVHTAYSLHFASDEVFYADGMEFFATAATQVTQPVAESLAA
jgi:hypothetical protein